MTQQSNHLPEVAMLVSLHISRWTARKTSKQAAAQVAEINGSKVDAVRATKDIIPREPIKAINNVYDSTFSTFKVMTLPWSDDGRRLVPSSMIMDLMAKMRAAETLFWSKVSDLQANYADLRAQAQEDLGPLFNEGDYPRADTVPAKFSFSYTFEPVPQSGDIRTELPDSLRAKIEHDLQTRNEAQLHEATRSLYLRVHEALGRMVRVLSADKPRIYESLMSDMQTLIAVLPELNMTNDAELADLSVSLSNTFNGVTSAELRENEGLRSIKAIEAQSALSQISALL